MKKNWKHTYRLLRAGEEDYAHDLILRVFGKHVAPTYTREGIKTFLGMLTLEFLRETKPEKFTIVAEQEGKLVGISSIVRTCHIALLFVDSQFQGRGIGKGLIQSCISTCIEKNPGLRALTVSSTPNSVSFYENVGFVKIGEEKDENGMRFIPMQKTIRT